MRRSPTLSLVLGLSLAACSRSETGRDYVATTASLGEQIGGGSRSLREGATQTILAAPPSLGGVGPLSEKIYADGWRQSLSLDRRKIADGWNDLAIDVRFEGSTRNGPRIPMGPPTRDGIGKEILARFPGVAMRVVRRPMANALGPYGLAVGAQGGVRCAFAWQWLEDLPGNGGWGGKRPASIRMRLCRQDVTADELAAIFDAVRLNDPSALESLTQRWKDAPESVLAAEKPQRPAEAGAGAGTLESALVGEAPSAPRPKGGARHGPNRRRPPQPPVYESAKVAPPPPRPPRRFLAPTGSAPAAAQAPAASARPPEPAPIPIDMTLPPQAYRGPASTTPPPGTTQVR